jgi:4-hydroxythreonine-4-phosphate dehydrogenase
MPTPEAVAARRPIVALAMGDPAGVSPELTARALALPEVHAAARIVTIGDARVMREGARIAGVLLWVWAGSRLRAVLARSTG